MGPDVRDAVLIHCQSDAPLSNSSPTANMLMRDEVPWEDMQTRRLVGDVEFHIRASDWTVHQHHCDPRYNQVILHVVLLCDALRPTIRQDGCLVPLCSLQDIPSLVSTLPLQCQPATLWPCHSVIATMSAIEHEKLFLRAGILRFEQKTHALVEQLHTLDSLLHDQSCYDACLLPALAEGLGYGRDRELFRATGLYLLGRATTIPEPLGRTSQPSPLDRSRLRTLAALMQHSVTTGLWPQLQHILTTSSTLAMKASLQVLRQLFLNFDLSLARTDILICNVVLPFAAAVALLEHDALLADHAQALYYHHPGLASNRVTRMMCQQLQLSQEPSGACQQQGLHYIYQQTCREKRCGVCIIGKKKL